MGVWLGCVACMASGSSVVPNGDQGRQDQDAGGEFAAFDAGTEELAPDAACAAAESEGKLAPVNLVFVFDRSGSMSDFNKWEPVVRSMKSFFADPRSKGVSASLTYFPKTSDLYCGSTECCSIDSYTVPSVPLTSLPNGTVFAASLDEVVPGGGTPTVPAMRAAIRQARSIAEASAHRGETTAVVLVTDGMPNDNCDPQRSSVELTAGAAQDANEEASSIKTYVVGIESPYHAGALDDLHHVARRGGTTAAILVMPSNAEGTAKAFADALDAIRSRTVSCRLPIPSPPEGKVFDRRKLNVTVSEGNREYGLGYDEACQGGAGWRYDDVAAPSFIELCSSSCSEVKGGRGTKLSVQFGCDTRIAVH
ncbi:VWA domain-containing protein [Pendulispora rubella]|uniref:VWA domain-containing protein n=1 Tax=Pendulispora rubella TaxID=2741070 RepID=A0ABZ2L4Z4_9BACT